MIVEDRVDPDTFHEAFPWAAAMIGCPHDQVYHAEGDPWVHTKMVVADLVQSDAYLAMAPERQAVMRLGAWFHDIAKPATTEVTWDEDLGRERVGQPGHAPLGATMAYQALLDAGAEIETAREVHALVFWHQRPFFMMSYSSSMKRAVQFSHDIGRGSWMEMLTLVRSDNRGRISANAHETLDMMDYLELALEEMGENVQVEGFNLLHQAWPFTTEEARMRFLRGPNDGSAFYMPENPTNGCMTIMSGLPGSGKDTVIASRFPDTPVVSLDDIRGQMDVGWKDNQGRVLQAGFEAARMHLRAGQDFIWNATGISRSIRQKIIGLARDYDFRIEGVSIDIPLSVAKARNKQRDRSVPDTVMDKLGCKRDPITSDEVHTLWSVDIDGQIKRLTPALPGLNQSKDAAHENDL